LRSSSPLGEASTRGVGPGVWGAAPTHSKGGVSDSSFFGAGSVLAGGFGNGSLRLCFATGADFCLASGAGAAAVWDGVDAFVDLRFFFGARSVGVGLAELTLFSTGADFRLATWESPLLERATEATSDLLLEEASSERRRLSARSCSKASIAPVAGHFLLDEALLSGFDDAGKHCECLGPLGERLSSGVAAGALDRLLAFRALGGGDPGGVTGGAFLSTFDPGISLARFCPPS